MIVLLETYIIYVDIYFIQNFFMKIITMYVSLLYMRQNRMTSYVKEIFKLIVVVFLGALLEVMGLLYIKPYWVFLLFVCGVIVPFFMWSLLLSKEMFFGTFLLAYVVFTLLMNAVLESLWNYFGENKCYILFILFSAVIVLMMVKLWNTYHQNQKGIYKIKLIHKGKEIFAKGYYDSGNCLKDPYSHKGVQIISKELLELILTGEEAQVYIPYQSLGNENGMIVVVYVDCILIYAEKEKKLEKVPVGVADDNLFKDKSYKVILNEGVL